MSQTVGDIDLKLSLNKKEYQKSLSSIKAESNSAASALSSIFRKAGTAVAAAFSVSAVKSFTQTLAKTAAGVSAANSQFSQTFGELGTSASQAMKRVADSSGIVQTRLQGVGTSIFAFAKTTGMDSANALNMMEEALRVTADSAAYYDRSLEDTAESLKSFLKGNYANDAALGLSCTETTRNAAANKLYGKSFKELSEAQKQLTLLQMVKDANAASGALGQAARESDGLENVLGNLKESWNQLLAVVGKPVLQGAVIVVKKLTTALTVLTEYAKAAYSALSELFGWNDGNTAQTAADTKQTAASISESVDNQNNLTDAVAKTNEEVKRGIASFDKLNVISKSEKEDGSSDGSAVEGALSSGLLSSSVDIDTGDAEKKIDRFKKKLLSLFAPIKAAWEKYFKPVMDKLKTTFDKLKKLTSEWLEKLDFSWLAKAFDKVFAAAKPLVDLLIDDLSWAYENVILPLAKQFIEMDLPNLLNAAAAVLNFIKPILEGLGNILKTLWTNILQPAISKISEWFGILVEKLSPKLKELGSKFSALFAKLQPIIEVLTTVLKPVILQLIDLIGGNLAGTLSVIISAVGDIVDVLSGVCDFITGVFTNDWKKAWSGVCETVYGAVNIVIDAANFLWQGLFTAIASIVNALGGLVKGIGSVLGQNWGWDMPTEAPMIPKKELPPGIRSSGAFASGGIVKAPTLAVVGDNAGASSGDPEVISPLSKLQAMLPSGSGAEELAGILDYLKRIYELFVIFKNQDGNVYEFAAMLDGNELFKQIIRQNEMYKKSHNGKSAFA